MVLATKSMGLNPDVLSFAYADMSSVSSPQRPRKNITLGTERLVQFHSADPEDLGIEIEHSDDGYVRIVSTSDDGMFEGTVYKGDIVCEIAGVNMRRPITEHMWKLTTGLMKVAPRPIEVIVAADESPAEGEKDEKEANGALHNLSQGKAREADNVDAEITQTPSLVKQAMSMWQSLNLSATSTKEEEQHDASDTASMSEGNEDSTVQLPDPYNDPGRFGTERTIIFHTDSLGVKLHRCPEEGIVQILNIDENVSDKARGGDDDGRLEVGDVIVEVGGVDLRHKFIGPLEWADMVYFVQNVGRPLDMVVAEDNHFVKELDDGNVELHANGQEAEEDASDAEAVQENADATELPVEEESVEGVEETDEEVVEDTEVAADEEVDQEDDLPTETESHLQPEEHLVKQQEDIEDEDSGAEPKDMMADLVEQYLSTEEEDVSPSVSIENEVQVHQIDRALQEMEKEVSEFPKFSPEWFLLKSKLVELRAVRATIEQGGGIKNDEGSLSSQDGTATLEPSKDASLIANAPGEKMEQKKSVNSFYFRTHPNKKISALNDAESSVVSRETVTTSDSSGPPSSPMSPAGIIEEEDVFEVITNSKQDKEVTFSSTFGEGLLSMDDGDDDDEEPFTGNVNFDAPPRVPVSALFSQAFVVQGGNDIGSPLFVVRRKTLPDQNKTAESSGYLHIEPEAKKAPKTLKPALDMSEIALHHDMSLESTLTTESAWDKTVFANVQADCCLLDTLCGDQMYQGLISDSADIRQSKENTDKKPRRKGLFRKLKRKKRKQDRNMLGYGSLDDDGDVEDLIVTKISNKTDANGFVPIDDEVDL